MPEKHDPNQLVGAAPDIAPLAWVIDEIRASLTDAVGTATAAAVLAFVLLFLPSFLFM